MALSFTTLLSMLLFSAVAVALTVMEPDQKHVFLTTSDKAGSRTVASGSCLSSWRGKCEVDECEQMPDEDKQQAREEGGGEDGFCFFAVPLPLCCALL